MQLSLKGAILESVEQNKNKMDCINHKCNPLYVAATSLTINHLLELTQVSVGLVSKLTLFCTSLYVYSVVK